MFLNNRRFFLKKFGFPLSCSQSPGGPQNKVSGGEQVNSA